MQVYDDTADRKSPWRCPRCGIFAAHTGQFCANCGSRLSRPQPVQPTEVPAPQIQPIPANLVAILIAAAAMVCAAAAALVVLYR